MVDKCCGLPGLIQRCTQLLKSEIPPEDKRRIRANDRDYNASYQYADNLIKTAKYNVLTFLPINLFEQSQRVANSYFIILIILQVIPKISSLNPVTTIVPLILVLLITAIKDGVDDLKRHKSDDIVNNRPSEVLRDGKLQNLKWRTVQVGDIIRMENNQFVAADLFLLSTSEPHSLCYIETAELDGETNLKCRQALPETAELGDDTSQLAQFDAYLTCDPPNNKLDKFEGTLEYTGCSYPLDPDNILLRGCVLRNTKWCYGMVMYAGPDTKLMQNSGKAPFKRTQIDRLLNTLVIMIFAFLVVICLLLAMACGVWEAEIGKDFVSYLPWDEDVDSPVFIAFLVFFSYIILMNTVVPISLYVSVEVIRMMQSWMIDWDEKMYYSLYDTPARARTTTLNEELGQIEYIFSDKTGTLTQNIMEFKMCSIAGKVFGYLTDAVGNPIEITERTVPIDLSFNPWYEPKFKYYDKTLITAIQRHDENVGEFFLLLSLCHTIMPEMKDGHLEYQAQSPDEGALVNAARNFGYVFKSRTPTTITVETQGVEETYELLCILDFNNVRKRMSVIVRKNGILTLYCKGADSIIYERLSSSCQTLRNITTEHLHTFACEGLRTLVLAKKNLDENYFKEWKKRHHEASIALVDREEKVSAIQEEIEKDMHLLGSTAIEDKLQDGVPDTIANLAQANIKIWVLTGDKQETAVNIGYSCQLLTDEMDDVFIIDGNTAQDVKQQLTDINTNMSNFMSDNEDVVFSPDKECQGEFALIINGSSLAYALEKSLSLIFLETACKCKAVICCRVTPLQKALVVNLVKVNKNAVTLSIGDGANDVSMIKTAHIGVGISGQEGMQAVLASDYSLGQFRYLERLLLVHGRWSYMRICKFLSYFFYKNFAFSLTQFWFAFFCGYSAQTMYDQLFITCYNMMYTALPVLAVGIFDQDVNDINSLKFSKLYYPGQACELFNKKEFFRSVCQGILVSFTIFFISYGVYSDYLSPDGLDGSTYQFIAMAVATTLMSVVTIQVALDMNYWTGLNHFVIWLSIVMFFTMQFILTSDFLYKLVPSIFTFHGGAVMVFSSSSFWLTLTLSCAVCVLPIIAVRYISSDVSPSTSDRIRRLQKFHKVGSRHVMIRRLSSRRISTRSGYAFAHQEGFGNLITQGINMRPELDTA